jgi:hypothetical protein
MNLGSLKEEQTAKFCIKNNFMIFTGLLALDLNINTYKILVWISEIKSKQDWKDIAKINMK